jgi:peptidoglycan/LPS O-acetylase OafA/YrhL
LLGSVLGLNEAMVFPGVIVLLPVLGSVLFLLGGQLNADNAVSRLAARRPWTDIGILSYGFYLWHWPLLALGRYWGLGERSLPRDLLLGGVLALLLAWLSYRYVEQPIRQKKLRAFTATKATLWSGFGMIVGMWLLGNVAMFLLPARRGPAIRHCCKPRAMPWPCTAIAPCPVTACPCRRWRSAWKGSAMARSGCWPGAIRIPTT